jgi:GNAT superfamily N-acetyltransferase
VDGDEGWTAATLRPAEAQDVGALVALHAQHYGGHFRSTKGDWLPQARPQRRITVAQRGGTVVGAATVEPQPGWPQARRVYLFAPQDGDWRLLHGHVVAEARAAQVRELFLVTQETSEQTCRLAAEGGYEPVWRTFGAHLDLAEGGTVPDARSGLPDGLAARELTAQDAEAAFALHKTYVADAPKTPATIPREFTAAGFARFIADNHAFGVFEGARCVALTMLVRTGNEAETEFTVTLPERRGHGLAGHVKTLAVRTLAERGVTEFATGGAVTNTAILRANERLGYHIEPLWITFRFAVG